MDQNLVDQAVAEYRRSHHLRIYFDDRMYEASWCGSLGVEDVSARSDDLAEVIDIANTRLERFIMKKLAEA
jgi:hypothetical protein